ncbi:MAG: hypothetical protein KGL10_06135 [Alphaproteobacteria bacterium]|nr:hypothetical protein [Alphaproteobacteria bacterium]
MIAALQLFMAYILPVPIAAACFYYHIFGGMTDTGLRLVYIGVMSVAPSVLLLIFALDRMIHSIFHILVYGIVFYIIYHTGLLGHAR